MSLLSDVRVLDLTIAWAGPLAGRFLADLGAEVIHVERPSGRPGAPGVAPDKPPAGWAWGTLPDPRTRAPVYPDADPGPRPWNRGGSFNKLNRNKSSLCLDLKHPEGRRVFLDLVRVSDVIIENNSARAMPGLGFDYPTLANLNPRLIMVSMPGFGATGPYADWVSLGPVLEAASGLAGATGYSDRGPLKLGVAYPDAIGGLTAAYATLAALWDREQTGIGCFVDLSQHEAYASIGGDLILAASLTGEDLPRLGNRSAGYAPQGVYPCLGFDEWVALTVRSDEEWQRFVELVGTESLRSPALALFPERLAAHDAIDAAIAEWTRERTKWDAAEALIGAGIPAAPALSNADMVDDPHLAARGFVVEIDQPEVGVRRFPGFPIHFSETPVTQFRGAAPLGANNSDVLRDVLGLADDEIADLTAQGVILDTPRG